MRYIYYKDSKGNFGDDLNAWLWPRFFGAHNESDNDVFVGIGSILCNDSPLFRELSGKRKIVFGTGIRPDYNTFAWDHSWDIRFLRGPLSAHSFNNKFEYIADAAYALSLTDGFERYRNAEKKYRISVIPYFKSLQYFNWESICRDLGYHFISPAAPGGIEHTLMEIAASEYVIAEAMHGAIIADILRVPWRRFVLTTPYTEGGKVSEFKWMDWLYTIDQLSTDTTYIKLYRKSFAHNLIKKMTANIVSVEFLMRGVVRNDILTALSDVSDFFLSRDTVITGINSRLSEKIGELKKEKHLS